jgi:hypothetical protein
MSPKATSQFTSLSCYLEATDSLPFKIYVLLAKIECLFVWKVDYWLPILTFKMKCFGCQHFIIWHKPVLLALNTNLSIVRLTTINLNLSKSMRVTINCKKMNVWHQTRPWQMARCAMKGIVTSQECNFLNGFKRKMHTPSCMYSKRCQLLCLCVRIAHRNSNVLSGCHCICHCWLSWTKPIYWNLRWHTKNISFIFI